MYIITKDNNIYNCEGEVKNFPCNARMVRLTETDNGHIFILNSDMIYAVLDDEQGAAVVNASANTVRSSAEAK